MSPGLGCGLQAFATLIPWNGPEAILSHILGSPTRDDPWPDLHWLIERRASQGCSAADALASNEDCLPGVGSRAICCSDCVIVLGSIPDREERDSPQNQSSP